MPRNGKLTTRVAREEFAKKVGGALTKFGRAHPEALKDVEPVSDRDFHLERLFSTLEFVDSKLPGMAEHLFKDFEDETTSVKDKTAIFKVFAGFALTQERLAKAMGLLKNLAEENNGLAIGTLLNINLGGLREMDTKTITARLLEGNEDS